MFVTAGLDLKFHNWPGETAELIYKPLESRNISSVSWSKDNGFLTFVSESGKPEIISLRHLDNIKNVHTISAVNGTQTIAFQRSTKRCIGMGTNSGQVVLYDTKNKAISRLFENAPCSVNFLDFIFGDRQMAVACENGSVLLYDTRYTHICGTCVVSNTCLTAMSCHPTEKQLLAIGVEDGTLMQWDIKTNQNTFCTQIHTAPVTGLVAVENSDLLVSVGYDHKFCIHDVSTGDCVFRINQQYPLTAVDVSPDGLTVAVGTHFGNLCVYDIRQMMVPIMESKPHSTRINKILFEHKLKEGFFDDVSEALSACLLNDPEEVDKPENRLVKRHADGTEKCEMKTILTARCTPDNACKCSPDKKFDSDAAMAIKSVKNEVMDSICRGAEELRSHLMDQIGSLHNFILNEFRTIDRQMEEKWGLLNLATVGSKETEDRNMD